MCGWVHVYHCRFVGRRTLLGQVSSRKAAEEALLSGFGEGKKYDDSASAKRIRFQFRASLCLFSCTVAVHCTAPQESVSVTVEFPADEQERPVEHFSLASLQRPSVGHEEEEEERMALVPASPPSRKKSASAPR